jgi:AraC-like DNA-binding protein
MPDADHVIPYHLVTEGSCYARLVDGDPVKLDAGDIVLFPAGDQHVLATASQAALRLRPVDISGDSLDTLLKRGTVAAFKQGGAGNATRIICGFLACERSLAEPILSLPRMLKVSLGDGSTGAWVQSSFKHSATESASLRPGTAVVLARLSEVLFAEAVRLYVDQMPAGGSGWLAALRDRYVGRTLDLLHQQPAHRWTVDELAHRVGLSRSALAQRFSALLGASPMQYLTRWRMLLASRHLRESRASVLQVATEVGYESEAAFNRAFKRELGLPPAAWRRQAARI